ncbi:RNA polymerase sigma factor [Caulobacter segnis]|uniref:RNA polymerase sigma factor n=1 Tax=Caulobacter segnis TaxID=88688 RepID=UPI00240FC34A|nr:RNA polymerase sigma factor [Caulobacter segnis]MDG2520271.1 RNA polymerase sigma factor [Caulobacter segnis]
MSGRDDVEDGRLARSAVDGDERAFTELMRRHKQALFRFVMRYVGDEDAAYEIVQESFVSAWLALKRFDPNRPFLVWLRAIAFNKCRDFGRRAKTRRAVFVEGANDFDAAEAHPDPAPSPERVALENDRLRHLDQEIRKLPEPLKQAFVIAGFGEITVREAAEVLGASPKAVEMRLYRARAILAKAFGLTP